MRLISPLVVLHLILLPLFAVAQQPVVQRLGDWIHNRTTLSGSCQGMAIHHNHIVMLRDGGQCVILD